MSDLSFLETFIQPVTVGLCLCVGWVIKNLIKDIDNKWIPTIVLALGIAISTWSNWGTITPEVILSGAASGLASTGLHQMVTKWFEKQAE